MRNVCIAHAEERAKQHAKGDEGADGVAKHEILARETISSPDTLDHFDNSEISVSGQGQQSFSASLSVSPTADPSAANALAYSISASAVPARRLESYLPKNPKFSPEAWLSAGREQIVQTNSARRATVQREPRREAPPLAGFRPRHPGHHPNRL
jgi:hypothetical protein